ncbi:HoxN/HupN/NixA family nickel/cobalt transporter [Kozakia baliensis]|uniref:Nickel/cobalt efflux system n=1 Tax=Kozakia baliensis TaxID=153496 RepID=A0A1D8UVG7_9PROT|nr:HoxN/HupN/NixA family nickel/cobalt transporter [Kozakia baliensis]AOX17497.1 nickel transporter [Kozakia baliensis]GBR30728.1 transporter with high-affinity to nickel [Kozakia baliensis NRIC 0488]GEL63039.1 nickel/cobalt efflux system [Kozakia baliensis]
MSAAASTPPPLRHRITGIYLFLAAFNLGAWIWAFIVFHAQPFLLGTGLLAYGFGLRHAVDADHIASIDNVTRKLMQEGKRPVSVGLFFALGHATVVVIVAALVALTASAMRNRIDGWKEIGGLIATGSSALFLFLIAAMNIMILRGVWTAFRQVRAGKPYNPNDLDLLLNDRGLLARIFRPVFKMVSQSWHMFPVGFLFGLGFDTATEVSLLGLSASQATQGVSVAVILVFPMLFAAGMALVDTTDGILMLGAYEWAFIRPIRKLYYNLVITFVSVLVALLIGGIETLGILAEHFDLHGPIWSAAQNLNENFNMLGFVVIGIFVAAWLISILIYRRNGYDNLPDPSPQA